MEQHVGERGQIHHLFQEEVYLSNLK